MTLLHHPRPAIALIVLLAASAARAQTLPQDGATVPPGTTIATLCSCEGNWCRGWPLPDLFPHGYRWQRKTVTSFLTGPDDSGIGGTHVTEIFLGGRCVKMNGGHAVTEDPAPPGFAVTRPGSYTLTITTVDLQGVADCNHPTCASAPTSVNQVTTDVRHFTVHSDCDCPDLGDIQQRIEEATLAIATYQAQKNVRIVGNVFRPADQVSYSPERREQVQSAVQRALDRNLKGRKALGAKGDTDSACNVTNSARTACMRETVQLHEEVHRRACRKDSATAIAESVLTGKDRFERDDYTMGQFIDEEIAGYQEELAFLNNRRGALAQRCRGK